MWKIIRTCDKMVASYIAKKTGEDMRNITGKIIAVLLAALMCALAGCGDIGAIKSTEAFENTYAVSASPRPTPQKTISPTDTPAAAPTATATATPHPEPYTDIILGGAGDIMVHIRQIDDADVAGGDEGYSFYHWFELIKPALEYPDLMIANLEGPIGGEEMGYNGYPLFNFPDEIVPAVKDSGIDVLVTANNHAMDRDISGIKRTIDMLDAGEMLHTGTWKSPEDRAVPLIVDVKGIKVGIISATYSMNGFERRLEPEVRDYIVCFIDKQEVRARIDLCKENGAEVIVICPHMGDELASYARMGIRSYAESYIEMGADIVFASHPHVVQPIVEHEVQLEDGTTHKGIIFYSLGNFVSGMYGVIKEAGMIGYVDIRRDNATGDISLEQVSYLPTYTLRHGEPGNLYHIVPEGQCLDFPEMVDDISDVKCNLYRINDAWEHTVSVVGESPAELLRYMPERQSE